MADLTQSSATTATTTPQYYTDYLTNLANKGTAAGNAAQYIGAQPLQTQAFDLASSNVGNYQPALANAATLIGQGAATDITGAANPYLAAGTTTSGLSAANPYLAAGAAATGIGAANPYLATGMAQNVGVQTASPYVAAGAATSGLGAANPYLASGLAQNTGAQAASPYLATGAASSGLNAASPYLTSGISSAADLVGGYMSPYTSSVVDQIRLANQQNIAQNLSPAITSGAVGAGQFGSQRGANALSLGISNANIGALGEQAKALQAGYAQSLAAAQAQRAAQVQAGQAAGTLANQYGANQNTAGQIAGTLQGQQAQNALTAGQTAGTLANQYGINQINAGQTLGTLQNQQAQNALNAGQTAGSLQNVGNANLFQAGQTAGTLQNAYNANQVQAGQVAGNVATQQAQNLRDAATANMNLGTTIQNTGLTDVNQLATMGAQLQQIKQNEQLFPLDVLTRQAGVLSGAQIPTTQTSMMTGSPLSAIAGLGSLVAGLNTANKGALTPWQNIMNGLGLSGTGTTPPNADTPFQAADGNWYATQAEADAATAEYLGGDTTPPSPVYT